MSVWTACFAPRKRHTSPEWTFMCSPTHSFNEKKLHFPIVCGDMMEVHWGQKDVWRNTISTAQSPKTYHQSEFHRNNIFKAQSETFDLLWQVLEVWEVWVCALGVWSLLCLSSSKFHIFPWGHNMAALITALIGKYTSILSYKYLKCAANLCRDNMSS